MSNIELRWLVDPDSPNPPKLQYRTAVVSPHFGPWEYVPIVVGAPAQRNYVPPFPNPQPRTE